MMENRCVGRLEQSIEFWESREIREKKEIFKFRIQNLREKPSRFSFLESRISKVFDFNFAKFLKIDFQNWDSNTSPRFGFF